MTEASASRVRLADLVQLRDEYIGQHKLHFVRYLDVLIAELEVEIAHDGGCSPNLRPGSGRLHDS